MRVVFAVVMMAAVMGAALAADVDVDVEGDVAVDVDVEADAEHPVLPGLGSPCFPRRTRSKHWRVVSRRPRSFRGVCTADAACPSAQHEPGYCAGIGVVCCKNPKTAEAEVDTGSNLTPADVVASSSSSSSSNVPVLRSTVSPCVSQGGTCGTPAACTAAKGTTKSGLCPGSATNICCFKSGTQPSQSLAALVAIPAGINSGLTIAGSRGLTAKIGQPGCPLTAKCFDCNCAISNTKITKNRVTLAVTPTVRITGLKPFVEAVKRAFDAIKAAGATNPLLLRVYNEVRTAGGLCCRPIKRSNGTPGSTWSNHSWGAAVDFYFGSSIDPRGDGKTQYGLLLMAPYFAAEKLYWAAGYKGSEEDAMHFEASQQALNTWTL